MTPPGQSVSSQRADGVLVSADTINPEGENQAYLEVVVTLEEGNLDLRLVGDRKGTIVMIPLAKVKEALRELERWDRRKRFSRGEDVRL